MRSRGSGAMNRKQMFNNQQEFPHNLNCKITHHSIVIPEFGVLATDNFAPKAYHGLVVVGPVVSLVKRTFPLFIHSSTDAVVGSIVQWAFYWRKRRKLAQISCGEGCGGGRHVWEELQDEVGVGRLRFRLGV